MNATLLGLLRVDGPWIHRAAPVVEVSVVNVDRDRRAERLPSPHSTCDLHLVVLDLHPSAAAVPVLPATQIAIDAIAIEPDAGRPPRNDDRQLRPVRFASGKKGEH